MQKRITAAHLVRAIGNAGLKKGWLVGGVLRNPIWDRHFHTASTTSGDVDVAFFDPDGMLDDEANELLRAELPQIPWDATNMALRGFPDVITAIASLPETATCIGLGQQDGKVYLLTPWGMGDLKAGVLRRSPWFRGDWAERRKTRNFKAIWPALQDGAFIERAPELQPKPLLSLAFMSGF